MLIRLHRMIVCRFCVSGAVLKHGYLSRTAPVESYLKIFDTNSIFRAKESKTLNQISIQNTFPKKKARVQL